MKLAERFEYAMHNLRYRQLRTWLTVLGIVVGIATIIILISLAGGLKASVEKQLSSLDPRVIVILPSSAGMGGIPSGGGGMGTFMLTAGKLYERDYQKVRAVNGVDKIAKAVSNRAPIKYGDEIISAQVAGVEPDVIREVSTINIQEGRFLQPGDRGVVVLGNSIANDAFDKKVNLGSVIEIAGRKFTVVGITEKSGASMVNFDNTLFIPFDEGRQIFGELLVQNEISMMQVLVAEGYNTSEVRKEIEDVLLQSHRLSVDEKDFTVLDARAVGEQVDSVIGVLTLFLGAVALIALAVGTIGVSNTMFMAVMERTHEIGVLKAIGATNRDIMLTFIIEAGIIGLVGGILGILFGTLFSLSLGYFGIKTMVTIELIVGSSLFAFAVGVVAGIIPAKNASEIPAIEALRYE
ncbi:MAG: ABC transporter permease [Candidatus Micrarchaeia archaeon]